MRLYSCWLFPLMCVRDCQDRFCGRVFVWSPLHVGGSICPLLLSYLFHLAGRRCVYFVLFSVCNLALSCTSILMLAQLIEYRGFVSLRGISAFLRGWRPLQQTNTMKGVKKNLIHRIHFLHTFKLSTPSRKQHEIHSLRCLRMKATIRNMFSLNIISFAYNSFLIFRFKASQPFTIWG